MKISRTRHLRLVFQVETAGKWMHKLGIEVVAKKKGWRSRAWWRCGISKEIPAENGFLWSPQCQQCKNSSACWIFRRDIKAKRTPSLGRCQQVIDKHGLKQSKKNIQDRVWTDLHTPPPEVTDRDSPSLPWWDNISSQRRSANSLGSKGYNFDAQRKWDHDIRFHQGNGQLLALTQEEYKETLHLRPRYVGTLIVDTSNCGPLKKQRRMIHQLGSMHVSS